MSYALVKHTHTRKQKYQNKDLYIAFYMKVLADLATNSI